jgi:hypothetical protein
MGLMVVVTRVELIKMTKEGNCSLSVSFSLLGILCSAREDEKRKEKKREKLFFIVSDADSSRTRRRRA